MPPRASSAATPSAGSLPAQQRRVEQEVLWGRPVFRPPGLGNLQVVHDPLPFRAFAPAAARGPSAR